MFTKENLMIKELVAIVISVLFIFSCPVLALESYSYVINDKADIRTGPGTQYEIINSVSFATMLELEGEDTNKDWIHVKLGSGNVGWISKNSITYLKTAPPIHLREKGAVDVKVAREQGLKWWIKNINSNPVCDICNTKVPRDAGYLLSSKQVLNSVAYHALIKNSYPQYYSQMIYKFEKDRTPWLICNICIEKYFFNVPGASNLQDIEKAMSADEKLNDKIMKTIKKYYSVEFVKDKLDKKEMWLAEDKENNTIYPITPPIGMVILKQFEEEKKQ